MKSDEYFVRAESWATDRLAQAERAGRRGWTAAAILAVVVALQAVALILLTPLKRTETVTLLVDRHTGYVQAIKPLAPQRLEASEALTRSYLAQYVTSREGFDRNTVALDYRRVALWSGGSARSSYLARMPADRPESPFRRYPPGAIVQVTVKSISLLDKDTALVRFDTQYLAQSNPQAPRPWIAIISYRYTAAPMRFEDRLANPLGFQVTSYRRDAEAPRQASERFDAAMRR